jgi:putative membrane-bound dehydrogenase-like protein
MKPKNALRAIWPAALLCASTTASGMDANRLTYLDDADPFYVNAQFPKLATPQWVGEPGVDAVIILAIDDMKSPGAYETFLRPILNRLKQIDGRAPVSIMCIQLDPRDPQYQKWLGEGLSLEVHTLSHPCPILDGRNFQAAANEFQGGVELIDKIQGNHACAFRTPCCDSMNSPSPRLFAELFNHTNSLGEFLTIDSSVLNILSARDPALPRELVLDAGEHDKFRKYVPFPSFMTTVENYGYPYVIDRLAWEFPAIAPSDWEAFHLHGANNPETVADWKSALDATVLKQGTFTMIFHPHGWIRNDQLEELVDRASKKYGARVKFLNFREAQERLDKNLLAGEPLRAANGQDNGVRLLDLNDDGYLDVVIGNEHVGKTRVWNPKENTWSDSFFPTALVSVDADGTRHDAGVRLGIISPDGLPIMLVRNDNTAGGWRFNGTEWVADDALLNGLELDGQPIFTSHGYRDRGVRLRDINNDGICELIVANESQNAVFAWSEQEKKWKKLPYALPPETSIVDAEGRDNGLRFVDVNEDGYDDVIFSNPKRYSFHLFIPEPVKGFSAGWSRKVISGRREGEPGEIPMIVRDGPNPDNGAWFRSNTMWVQNEDTATLPDKVDRRSFKELMTGGFDPPKSPEESLACMHARPGFKVELVASEPLTRSPIAFDWGADGKLWVVEMGDYPLGLDGKGKAGGIVRFLEDTKGDGHYDKSTVFLNGLPMPTGIIPWRKGVIVCDPPEVFYAEDTNGDGRADIHVTLYSGFVEGNPQHRANGFDYGLDNWLYGGNGNSGGVIASPKTGKSVNISGLDFRFQPDDGAFEAQAGQGQYGRHRDDWGNWFSIDNPSPGWHYFLPIEYLSRNPFLPVRSTRQVMANYPDATRLYPISRLTQRFNDPSAEGHFTSANSIMPYRDELFGPDFAASYFVSEPVHNLIHRENLVPDGVSFTSHRAADEQTNEFLASTDTWFRPTMTRTGPDGALYVADMYRLVIEHPEWIPLDIQKDLDLRAGADKGRIYRVYPANATLRQTPRLDQMNAVQLATAMESPNGWQRDTAERLLVESGDKSAVAPLEELVSHSPNPKTRLQALCTLDCMHALKPEILVAALKDAHPAVRERAVRISEPIIGQKTAVDDALLGLADDPNIRVRYQLAFSLGVWPAAQAGRALARIALHDFEDERVQIAVMSSATNHLGAMIGAVLQHPPDKARAELLKQLVGLAAALKDEAALRASLVAIARNQGSHFETWQLTALSGLLGALDRRKMTLAEFASSGRAEVTEALTNLNDLFAQARKMASAGGAADADRVAAIRLLARGLTSQTTDREELGSLLGPQNSQAVQAAALANLAQLPGDRTAELLVGAWKSASPPTRVKILNILSSRQEWIQVLLAAIASEKISAAAIGTPLQQKLLNDSQADIRERARKLFSATSSDREGVVKRYQMVNELRGDSARGAAYFRANCTPCHRLQNEGNEVGPDLGSVAFKPVSYLLTAILDPNQSVEARYTGYMAVTKNDLEYSGIIATETPNSITMRQPGGAEIVILRSELKELSSSGRSLMPDGFENAMKPQALADLISYIGSRTPPKRFDGNKPEIIGADVDGSLGLPATGCKIFGDTLVFERQYQNLGYWQSDNDHAVWTVEVPKSGNYEVWFDWALPDSHPENTFRLECENAVLEKIVPQTGSWDTYQQARLGSIALEAGQRNILLAAEPPVKDSLLDLREIRLVPAGQSPPAGFLAGRRAAK